MTCKTHVPRRGALALLAGPAVTPPSPGPAPAPANHPARVPAHGAGRLPARGRDTPATRKFIPACRCPNSQNPTDDAKPGKPIVQQGQRDQLTRHLHRAVEP